MSSRVLQRLSNELNSLEERSRLRMLAQGTGINFTSNDYLGLSDHPDVLAAVAKAASNGTAHGSTGSRLLSGNHREHLELEAAFARFVDREAALYFSSGFAANLGVLSTLPTRHDLILLDTAAHASLKEGARASLAAKQTFQHNDIDELRRRLERADGFRHTYVVVEGIYSMDGDAAPLREISRITAKADAALIVDEAHATGLYGENLRGLHETVPAEFLPFVTIHPCGKALGSAGALVAADRIVTDYLVNTCRPFLFSTAPSPLNAVALRCVLDMLPHMHERVQRLFSLSRRLRNGLTALKQWTGMKGDSPIVPIIIGRDDVAVAAAALLQREGFDVRPIRPPTVPAGSARLRITLNHKRSEEDVDRLTDAIINAEATLTADSND